MQLRPVNAIFYNAKYKFIVVYQQGTLWQLPRMKVDIDSWRRRLQYNGENSDLYFYPHQIIADEELAKIIPTHDFPESLNNCNLQTFENWWLGNAHHWIKPQDANKPNLPSLTLLLEETEKLNPQVEINIPPTTESEIIPNENMEDFFDNLLENWDNL